MKRMIAACLAVLLFLAAPGCSVVDPPAATPTLSPNITSQQQALASAEMGLVFPMETQFLLFHHQTGWQDDAVTLKIELSPAALEEFLRQEPLASAEWNESGDLLHDDPDWPDWRPSTVKKYRAADFLLPSHEALKILIDDDQADRHVVYLFWFEV